MKKIGTFEKYFSVYHISRGKFKVTFEYKGYVAELSRLCTYERLSEETLAFVAEFKINDKHIGSCDNSGKGACANVRETYNVEVAREFKEALSDCENYCFPTSKISIYDVADYLACYNDMFAECKNIQSAENLIKYCNDQAEIYRLKYA
jgi:hypothetical protein